MENHQSEIEELRARNRELEETLDAIRFGEVDAIVVSREQRRQVYTLEGADHPYRVLVENIREGALTLAETGMILYANTAFAVMRRQPLSGILGTSLRDQILPRDRGRFDALLETSLGGPARDELHICSGTSSFPVLVSMTPMEVDGSLKLSVVVSDRKEDADRLRLLARMLDSVVDAVTAVDPGGTIIYWNEAAERMYGWQASEMAGRTLADTIAPGMRAEDERRVFEELAAGETWCGEHEARHRDGRSFPVLATRAPVYDEDGRLVAIIGTSHDISERKRAEEDMRRSNEELQRFAYVASHDLQEPLRSIVSFSQLLARRYRGKLDQDADDYIAFIVEGGIRMQTLIQDLLQVSRVETGAKPLEPTDAVEVAYDAILALEASIRASGAIVTVGDLPAVMADSAQLEQVFANLVGNAIKYHRDDVPPEIRIEGRRVGPRVEIAVRDNGIGIEAEYFERIFEMFRRLHTHDEYEGTGIGLAVVKRIVDRHGGRIWVTSTPGEGSTFFFTLPAA